MYGGEKNIVMIYNVYHLHAWACDPRCAIISILQLLPGSLVILAPVCSSFSFMSSSQNCRYLFMPEGNQGLSWVKAGNVMSVRVTLLCYLCAALGLVFILEQPASGKFALMPRWEYFCQKVCYVCGLQLVYCWFHPSFYKGSTLYTRFFGVVAMFGLVFGTSYIQACQYQWYSQSWISWSLVWVDSTCVMVLLS